MVIRDALTQSVTELPGQPNRAVETMAPRHSTLSAAFVIEDSKPVASGISIDSKTARTKPHAQYGYNRVGGGRSSEIRS